MRLLNVLFVFALLIFSPKSAVSETLPSEIFQRPCSEMIVAISNSVPKHSRVSEDDYQDAVLNVYKRCLKVGPRAIEKVGGAEAYLKTAIGNAKVDRIRRQRRMTVDGDLVSQQLERLMRIGGSEEDAGGQLQLEAQSLAYAMADDLKESISDTEIAVLLMFLLDFSAQEIGNAVKASTDNTYKIKKRAEEKLARIFKEHPGISISDIGGFVVSGFMTLFLGFCVVMMFSGAYSNVRKAVQARGQHTAAEKQTSQTNKNVNVKRSVNLNN